MTNNTLELVERATSDMLIGPDWAINMEICDIINADPRQAKDVLKTVKKRLGNKSSEVQILSLSLLETLSKNCGETVFHQVVESDVLREMVKTVKKKPALNVKEKILILIDTWQEALGGQRGKFPQYHSAYSELQSSGIEFPPRSGNAVPLFTPLQAHPVVRAPLPYEDTAWEISLPPDHSGFGLEDIESGRGAADILIEILGALDSKNAEGVNEELVMDVVGQCRSYQERVASLINSSENEELLRQALDLNDYLQHVLKRHDEIAKGVEAVVVAPAEFNEEVEEDDFDELARRRRKEESVDILSGGGESYVLDVEDKGRAGVIPPPPSKSSQRQRFFEKRQGSSSSGSSNGGGGDGGGLSREMGDLSMLSSSTDTQHASSSSSLLFKDLVDLAKARPTAKHGGNKPS